MTTGQRFDILLDEQSLESKDRHQHASTHDFVGDIQERPIKATLPPTFPTLKSNTGFPTHTKRNFTARPHAKERKRASEQASASGHGETSTTTSQDVTSPHADDEQFADQDLASRERRQISLENEQRISTMSKDEIEEARNEILGALDPLLLQRLLKRSNINSGSNEAASIDDSPSVTHIARAPLPAGQSVALDEETPVASTAATETPDDREPHLHPDSIQSIHFPRAPQPPELDPTSSTFLEDLHSKYFPSLPADPEKLEWMRVSNNAKSSYDPAQAALNPGDIRFDFKGALIPPSHALAIPVSAGLHHHGDAPDAAGYTIPELAHLSRSTYAPQRCIAFQTLGRILFRLCRGEFGDPGEPKQTVGAENTFGELARGLWQEVESQHVIEQLVAESEGNGVDGGRHVSAKAYATEAVWLWQKGGGRRWKTS